MNSEIHSEIQQNDHQIFDPDHEQEVKHPIQLESPFQRHMAYIWGKGLCDLLPSPWTKGLFVLFVSASIDQAWKFAYPYVTTPLFLAFLIPFVLYAFICISAFIFYLHQRNPGRIFRRLRTAVIEEHDIKYGLLTSSFQF